MLDADQYDEELVNTLKEKQTFEFRLGDLFRKKNVSAVMVDWDQNGDGSISLPELQDALSLLGHESEISEFFTSIDVDKSG